MRLHRLLLALSALLVPLMLATAPPAQAQESCPRLDGLFLQPLDLHRRWTASDWTGFFEELAAMRVGTLVLQWTELDHFTVFDGDPSDALSEGLIDLLLDAAEGQGIAVRLGLVQDPAYWERIQRDAEQVEVYLRRHRLANRALAERLVARIGDRRAFDGWYITEEIDEVNWQDQAKRALLHQHLVALAGDLRALAPGRSIAISGFTGARLDPAALGAFWREVLEGTGIDLLMLQDGFGVQPMLPSDLALYLDALRRAAGASGAALASIPELFTQTGGTPIDEGPFAAAPAPIERIEAQLEAAMGLAVARIGFSAEYITSAGGRPSALALQRQYLSWLQQRCR